MHFLDGEDKLSSAPMHFNGHCGERRDWTANEKGPAVEWPRGFHCPSAQERNFRFSKGAFHFLSRPGGEWRSGTETHFSLLIQTKVSGRSGTHKNGKFSIEMQTGSIAE